MQDHSPVDELLQTLDDAERQDDDWAIDEISLALASAGRVAIPALAAFLANRSHGLHARIAVARSISEIGRRSGDARTRSVEVLVRQLAKHPSNDPALNAFLIDALIDLDAREAALLIEQAFAADTVDCSVVGVWNEVATNMGLLAADEPPLARRHDRLARTPMPLVHYDIDQEGAQIVNWR